MKKILLFALLPLCFMSAKAQVVSSEWKSFNLTNMQLKQWLNTEAGSLADTVTVTAAVYRDNYNIDTLFYCSFVNNQLIEKDDNYLNTDEAQYFSWWLAGYLQTWENGHTGIRISGSVNSKTPFSFFVAEDTTYAAFVGKGEFISNTLNNSQELAITYASSKPNVAKVNAETGAIEVMSVGQTTVTASYAGEEGVYPAYQASYTLTVVNKPFDDYRFVDFNTLEIYEGDYWYESGSYSYDPETYTLTLDNYRLVSSDNMWFQFFTFGTGRPSPIPLNVYVKGNCQIISRGGGIHAGADVIIRGDEGATLAMFSYIPPIETYNRDLTVDGVSLSLSSESHPNFAGKTFIIKNDSYVHLQENAYIKGETEHTMELLIGDLQMDTEIGVLTPGVHYGTEEIEQWGEKQTFTTFFFSDLTIAPVVELGKVQRPQPITEQTTVISISMKDIDIVYNPAETNIDGIFYSIAENDSIIDSENCLEISSTMSEIEMQQIASLFSSSSLGLAQSFRGVSFLLPAGEGEIYLNAMTLGTHQLGVKIGSEQDTLFTIDVERTVTIQYNIAQPQMVFIYGYVEPTDEQMFYSPLLKAKKAQMLESEGSVKIYDITIIPKTISVGTAIEDIITNQDDTSARKILNNGQIVIYKGGKIFNTNGTQIK